MISQLIIYRFMSFNKALKISSPYAVEHYKFLYFHQRFFFTGSAFTDCPCVLRHQNLSRNVERTASPFHGSVKTPQTTPPQNHSFTTPNSPLLKTEMEHGMEWNGEWTILKYGMEQLTWNGNLEQMHRTWGCWFTRTFTNSYFGQLVPKNSYFTFPWSTRTLCLWSTRTF